MRIKIYQISKERDGNDVKFFGLKHLKQFQGSEKVDASLYDEVFDGEVDTTNLEMIFRQFNHEGHPLFRGHSLSVSDVVVMDGKAHFCESVGFEQIEFDESLTKKPDNLIRVLYVEPHKAPYVAEIENDITGMQRAVQGLIEHIYNDDGTIIVINDECKINGMEGNRRTENDVIAGPFFIAGDTGEDLCSLTDEQIEKYATKFAEPEDISQEEIKEHTGFTFIAW